MVFQLCFESTCWFYYLQATWQAIPVLWTLELKWTSKKILELTDGKKRLFRPCVLLFPTSLFVLRLSPTHWVVGKCPQFSLGKHVQAHSHTHAVAVTLLCLFCVVFCTQVRFILQREDIKESYQKYCVAAHPINDGLTSIICYYPSIRPCTVNAVSILYSD